MRSLLTALIASVYFSSSYSRALKQYGFDLNSSHRLPREADKVTRGSDLKLACAAQEACGILGRKPQGFAKREIRCGQVRHSVFERNDRAGEKMCSVQAEASVMG
jgi:hypothetical protein